MVVDFSCGALKNTLQSTFGLPNSSHFGFLDGKSFNPGLMRINEANFSNCQSIWRAVAEIQVI